MAYARRSSSRLISSKQPVVNNIQGETYMEPGGILAILFWLTMLVMIKTGFIGMAILIQHNIPEFVERASVHYRPKRRWWVPVLGFANALLTPLIAIILMSTGILAIPGIVLLLVYLGFALVAYTVAYREAGAKLFDDLGTNAEVKRTLYGGLILEAAFFTPFLGQLYSILLFIRSLGAVTIALLSRKKSE
jgi:hypothetical protein